MELIAACETQPMPAVMAAGAASSRCGTLRISAAAEPDGPDPVPRSGQSSGKQKDPDKARGGDDRHQEIVQLLPKLRVYARALARDPDHADDLVQTALLRAIQNIHQFQPGTDLRAWLFTILRNSFYSSYNRRKREPTGALDCVSTLPSGIEETQLWNIQRRELLEAVAAMPAYQREALILVTVVGASYLEAAEILGCDVGTIKSRINRARHTLRAALGDVFTR